MKIVMIGPVYPYKTGLSYYTTLLYNQLKKHNEVSLFSYSMQYPKLLMKREINVGVLIKKKQIG